MSTIVFVSRTLLLTGLATPAFAQEVTVPDPGLNAAIRETLQKPAGPLTEQDLLSLTNLNACCRDVGSLEGLEAARNLTELDLEQNQIASFSFPSNLTSLAYLDLSANPLTNLSFPDGLTNLNTLIIEGCGLTNLALPAGLTSLMFLELGANQLTNLSLPADLRNLNVLDIDMNQLTSLALPGSLTNLNVLALQHNQLTTLTVPPEMTRLTLLLLGGNPLASLVLSEPLAGTLLADLVASLRSGGISVHTYPLSARLASARPAAGGGFEFTLIGPPGAYAICGSVDLAIWSTLGAATNELGSVVFTDSATPLSPRKFYRARQVR